LFESIAVAPLASPAAAGGTGPTTANAPPAKAEPAKPPPAKSQAALEPPPKPQAAPRPEDPALACSRDELRLACRKWREKRSQIHSHDSTVVPMKSP
jgi:hypothetical protein